MIINAQDLSIQTWHSLLKNVQIQEQGSSSHVVCSSRKNDQLFYEVLSRHDWESLSKDAQEKSRYSKLRLQEIISISDRLMAQKSCSVISLNPLFFIFMPITGWKKRYDLNLFLRRVPEIIKSKNIDAFFNYSKDQDGQQVSQEIIQELQVIEIENQQLREIYTTLKSMSQKAEANRLKRTQTVWQKCMHWLYTSLFGTKISQIERKLEREIGDKDQVLDMGRNIVLGYTIQHMNYQLKEKGKEPIPLKDKKKEKEVEKLLKDGQSIRTWTYENLGPATGIMVIKLSHIVDNIEKAKTPKPAEKST